MGMTSQRAAKLLAYGYAAIAALTLIWIADSRYEAIAALIFLGVVLAPAALGWLMAVAALPSLGRYVLLVELIAFVPALYAYLDVAVTGGSGSTAGLAFIVLPIYQLGFLAAALLIGRLYLYARARRQG
jgi:hypothetical protein